MTSSRQVAVAEREQAVDSNDKLNVLANAIAKHTNLSGDQAREGVVATRDYFARAGVAATTTASNARIERWLRSWLRELLHVGLDIDQAYAFARLYVLMSVAAAEQEHPYVFERVFKAIAAAMGAFKGRN